MMRVAFISSILLAWAAAVHADDTTRRTENVVVVTWDGFRWQEFFTGADEVFIDEKSGGVRDVPDLRARYLRPSADERRRTLLPFVWGTIAKKGQIFGDRSAKAPVRCSNGLKFSFPGYSEMFCGLVDPRIDSNDKKDNPNLSVFEFLNAKPNYEGRVAAFCTWDVFPYIFRSGKNGLKVHAGWVPIDEPTLTGRQRYANELMDRLPRYWPNNVFDAITMEAAKEHLVRHKPRVMYIALGETDEWGHGRRYDLYLDAAHNGDRFLSELWHTLEGIPQYQGKTSLVLTTDHGRGMTRIDWTDHGRAVLDAEHIWIAVLGPDTPALGVRKEVESTQSQVATTIAALLGEDFRSASPNAASPLPAVIKASDQP